MCAPQCRQERTPFRWPGEPYNRIQAIFPIPPLPSGSDKIIGGTTFVRGRMLLFEAAMCSQPTSTALCGLPCGASADIAYLQCWLAGGQETPCGSLVFATPRRIWVVPVAACFPEALTTRGVVTALLCPMPTATHRFVR